MKNLEKQLEEIRHNAHHAEVALRFMKECPEYITDRDLFIENRIDDLIIIQFDLFEIIKKIEDVPFDLI